MNLFKKQIHWFTIVFVFIYGFIFQTSSALSQCHQVYDGFGILQTTPYFIGCSGSDYTIFVQTDIPLGNYTINWGDGSPNSTGASLTPPAFVQHTYTATVDTFNISITDNSTGCTINGVVVLEEPVNSSIQIPLGGVTVVCAPSPIDFINSSTNVSPTTTFTWDFGDGTPPLIFDHTNAGQTVTHTYQRNTVSCETVVTLTAENYCSFGNPTIANFSPLMVYDLDTAVINASATLLCYPDTVVHFTNATLKNCLPEGNVQQRYEYWNLGDYWGLGYDSIIPWTPFDPPAQPGHTIAFPGIGSYSIMMIDSNMCGQDTAYITVTIIPPPAAGLSITNDSACVGETVTFTNNSGSGSNIFFWDFGDGNGFNQYNGNPTFNFSNTGNTTVTMIAGITGTSGVCQDTTQTNIYIKPSPVASFGLDANQACDSLTVNITDSTSGAVAWQWNLGNGNSSTLANPPTQYYNAPGTYNINLFVTHANGCTDTETNSVNVYESPVANFVANSVCQNAVASFTDLSTHGTSDPITSWSWDFGDGNSSMNQNSTNIYNTTGGYQVTLIVATPHCADTISDSVTVETTPTAAFLLSDTIGCSPLVTNTTNNSVGATIYNWDFGNGYGSNAFQPLITYLNSDTVDTNYTLTLIAETNFGCKDTAQMQVTVYGGPEAGFTSNSIPECGPVEVNFTNTSNAAVSYLWDFGDSTVTSNLENPSHIFGNTTLFISNYNVNLVATNAQGCTDTATQVVTIYPEPDFPFSTIPDSGCSPLTVTFPAIIGAVSYQWDFGDGTTATGQTPSHTFYNSTTNDQLFTVQLVATSPFGCVDTTTEIVTVFPEPTAIFTLSDTIGCGPLDVMFTNGSLNATSYYWDFGDGDTSTANTGVLNHIYSNVTSGQAVYSASLIASTTHGCHDTTQQDVTVHPPVFAGFTADTAGCTPLSTSYSNTTQGAATYLWDFGDGGVSTAMNPNHVFYSGTVTDTTYSVTLVATSSFGCVDTIQNPITVYHNATAAISSSVLSGCTPLDVNFSNNSYGFDNIFLDYGDGNILNSNFTNQLHTYINATPNPVVNVVEIIASTIHGCNDTAQTNITVYPSVQADFSGDSVGCSPLVINFQNNSVGSSSYQWDFGNGNMSNSISPTETFTATGQTQYYTTSLLATSSYGCTDSIDLNITVHPTAVASFSSNMTAGCTPLNVGFTNSSLDYDNLLWDFGDGTSSNSIQGTVPHLYVNSTSISTIYNVTLVASTLQGCNDTSTAQVEVYPPVIADAQIDSIGCSPFYVQFNNNSIGASNYLWDLGNGIISTNQNPDETYTNTGNTPITIPITLTSTSPYGCTDVYNNMITVYPQPIASFLATPAVQAFPSTMVNITNTSAGSWTYNWDLGNGTQTSNMNPGTIDYLNIGDYTITLIISNPYCADTAEQLIQILPPPPTADFTGGQDGCAPVTVSFTNNSIYGTDYLWDFGDGNTSIQENPVYTYFFPGIYTVSLKVTGVNGTDTQTKVDIVEVFPNAIANFDYQPIKVSTTGDKTFFYNQSANATIYNWDFGDGSTSTEENPIYQYQEVGSFPITLIANNQYNCPDTLVHATYISVEATGDVTFPNAFVPDPSGPNGGMYDPGVIDNSVFYPISQGVDQYHLVIYNRWGELVFETFDINQGWDGYYRGEMSAQDVYVWKADVILVNGEQKVYSGDVTLLQ
ncbi:PKD domain-containing protein [bacterium SCSIO 12643]|nr:PKD domain-containing protein [bacterium SCSIO 12643]